MAKFYRGKIVKTAFGGLQFVRNKDTHKDFLLVTSRQGDLYIPCSQIDRAMQYQWDADCEARGHRIAWAISESETLDV